MQSLTFSGLVNMPRRALKSAQKQEDWRRRRNEESLTCCRDSGTKERTVEKMERDRARRVAQTARATSQWKSTRERERTAAETPEKDYNG